MKATDIIKIYNTGNKARLWNYLNKGIFSKKDKINAIKTLKNINDENNNEQTIPKEYLKVTCEYGVVYLNVSDRENIHWINNNINGIAIDGKNLYLTKASGDTTINFETNINGFVIEEESIEIDSITSITSNSTITIDLHGLYSIAKIYIGGL